MVKFTKRLTRDLFPNFYAGIVSKSLPLKIDEFLDISVEKMRQNRWIILDNRRRNRTEWVFIIRWLIFGSHLTAWTRDTKSDRPEREIEMERERGRQRPWEGEREKEEGGQRVRDSERDWAGEGEWGRGIGGRRRRGRKREGVREREWGRVRESEGERGSEGEGVRESDLDHP